MPHLTCNNGLTPTDLAKLSYLLGLYCKKESQYAVTVKRKLDHNWFTNKPTEWDYQSLWPKLDEQLILKAPKMHKKELIFCAYGLLLSQHSFKAFEVIDDKIENEFRSC